MYVVYSPLLGDAVPEEDHPVAVMDEEIVGPRGEA